MWKSGEVAVALGGGLGLISHSPKCLRIFLTEDSIAQNFVVSASALGAILPKIRNLAIACICFYVGSSCQAPFLHFLQSSDFISCNSIADMVHVREWAPG